MGEKYNAGQLRGIPLVIDGSFLLIALLWLVPSLMAGSAANFSFMLYYFAGIAGSIILHELGHAWAGQRYGVATSHIELNACGGRKRSINRFCWRRS